MGFFVHGYELILHGLSELSKVEIVFFFINLVFPILLVFFSYMANKEIKQAKNKVVG